MVIEIDKKIFESIVRRCSTTQGGWISVPKDLLKRISKKYNITENEAFDLCNRIDKTSEEIKFI